MSESAGTPISDEELFLNRILTKPGDAVTSVEFMRVWGIAVRATKAERELADCRAELERAQQNAQMHFSASTEFANRARAAESRLASHAERDGAEPEPRDPGPMTDKQPPSPAGPDALAEELSPEQWQEFYDRVWDSHEDNPTLHLPTSELRRIGRAMLSVLRSRPAQGDRT